MLVDWNDDFQRMLDDLERKATGGDWSVQRKLDLIAAQIQYIEELDDEPRDESPTLRRVRQSKRYPVWRLSHPFEPGIAARTIVWFMDTETAVVVLFSGDKAGMGDVFYDSVGTRADQIIEKFMQEDGK